MKGVGAVVLVSVVAVGVVAGLVVTQHPPATGSAIVWPRGSSQRPELECDAPGGDAIYDNSGFSTLKNPKDAVVEVFPDLSQGWPWPPDVIAGLTRNGLVEVWHQRDQLGVNAVILLRVDGSYLAEYDVQRSLLVAGEPVRWRDSGWTVGSSTVCQFPIVQS